MDVNIVKSGPTKDFFISMITRDIILIDAIIELIDNSIDGIKRLKSSDYQNYQIDITMNKDEFIIKDNCGGIDIDIARKYAFKFGRPSTAKNDGIETTGTFGIGMKRALFKMGKNFKIDSIFSKSHFILDIDVIEWAKNEDNWDFEFNYYDENEHSFIDCGTTISVSNLIPGISASMTSIPFINSVIAKVQQRASYEILNGLKIFINGTKIESNFIKIVNDNQIKPYKEHFTTGEIDVIVLAGIATQTNPNLAGWYIYCNGREILRADKSFATTWEGENIKYHNDYAAFRGFVFFTSTSPELLPWNTTKTGIDTSTNIYLTTQQHMQDAFKSVISELKKIYSKEDDERLSILQDISKRSSFDINYYSSLTLQNNTQIHFVDNYTFPENHDPEVRISYTKPKSQVDLVKKKLNANSNKDVGIMTFEYYSEMEGV